jgi:cell wall-associated NlpC family hydrolase
MSKTTTEQWRQIVVSEAQSWLRTKWAHGCRVKGAGVDCGQLIAACFVNTGLVEDFCIGSYPRDWMLNRSEERFLQVVQARLRQVDGPPQPGDVAVWKYGRCFSHGAVVIAWPSVIHAHVRARCVVVADADKGELQYMSDGSTKRPVLFFSLPAEA